MVHRPDDAAGGVEDDVEEDHPEGDPLAHHPEHHEDVGDHHRGEQLKEVLDPQVDDPEPPELRNRERGVGPGQQPHGVERRDRQRGEEEQPGHVALRLPPKPGAEPAPDDRDPDEQPGGQQALVDEREVEILPLLGEQRTLGPRDAVDRQRLAGHGADDDDDDGAEQDVGEGVLPSWFPSGDERGQEDAGGQERRGGPEQRELQVPGPGEVERQPPGQVETEEGEDVRPVVLCRGPQDRLHHEEQGDDEEEPCRGPLARGQPDLPGLPEGDRRRLRAVPADVAAPPPIDGEHCPGAAQQDDQGQDAPHDDVGRRAVVDPRLGRPVVGVGV